ncbi:MAG TPA: biopolymer transporter ExbD [Bryobacteraceae bacterium]|jgi:biopolymer transport protein ExbD|nr:biopolymer transporter ExbD [Bryobacteraceae bacterium]
MAINVGGMNGGRRSRGTPTLSEINVTPFVDVALVLLIIFMITAHAMESGIEIDVPKTRTVATTTKELPIVSLTKSGDLYLGKDPINLNNLVDAIHTRYPGQTAVYVKADRETTMELGVNVMSVLGNAKFGINVVTQLDDNAGRKR